MNPTLEEILIDENACHVFLDFIHRVQSQEMLEFWIEVEIFRGLQDGTECIRMGQRIYNKYLKIGSDMEVLADFKSKEEVRKTIDKGIWDRSLFDNVQEKVYHSIVFDCLRVFLETTPLPVGKKKRALTRSNAESSSFKPSLTLIKHLELYREKKSPKLSRSKSPQFTRILCS